MGRKDRPLGEWLLRLVDDRPTVRRAAGKAIQKLWGERIESGADDFSASVRAAVAAPDFPTADYVERLCALRIAITRDWRERCDRQAVRSERTNALFERTAHRLSRDAVVVRAVRLAGAECARDQRQDATAEALSEVGMASSLVFGALDTAFLTSETALPAVLDYQPERYQAFQALTRIGPPALRFAPALLARLDAGEANDRYEVPRVLGSVGCGDPATVAAVIDRLGNTDPEVRNAAVATLGHMGPDLAGRTGEVTQRLLAACDDEPTGWWAVGALTQVAPTDPRVADRVLAMMAPRPPVMEVHEQSGIRYEGDRAMYERGYAITAAARLTAFADRVVPALVEALDSFVEFDPDHGYHGEQARVCDALAAFGPAAAPAVPKLAVLLAGEDGYSGAVVRLIAAVGRPAAVVLPRLLELRGDDDNALDPGNELDAAILAVRG